MQTKDLKVGTDYAYEPWKYAEARRVKVLETKATGTKQVAWRTEPMTGVKIEFVSGDRKGETEIVQPQTIKRPWAEEHAARVALGKHRAEQARREQAERAERAQVAFRLHEEMVRRGAKVGISSVHNDEDNAALVAAGFQPVDRPEYFMRASLHSAVNDLDALMDDGTVGLEYVQALLGLSEPPKPGDSLDDYDFEDED